MAVGLALLAGLLLIQSRPDLLAQTRPREVESVCRGIVQLQTDPDPAMRCDTARLSMRFQHSCADQRVHIVYAVSPDGGPRWGLGLRPSVRALNMGAHDNIHVGSVLVPEGEPPKRQALSNDQTTVLAGLSRLIDGVPGSPSQTVGCATCALEEALGLLRAQRDVVHPDEVVEFIAIWGGARRLPETATPGSPLPSPGPGTPTPPPPLPTVPSGTTQPPGGSNLNPELEAIVDQAKAEGVRIISAERELASGSEYWMGGLSGLEPIFTRIAVDYSGTFLRDMELSLQLPQDTAYVAHSAQPPGYRVAEDTGALIWDDPPWSFEGITLTLDLDLLEGDREPIALPQLHARLTSWRGRSRDLILPEEGLLPVEDGCAPAPRPSPDLPAPTIPPRPSRTPWPTPTIGPSPTSPVSRPMGLFLPWLGQHRCPYASKPLDVVLTLDSSTSMRGQRIEGAVAAALDFLNVMETASRRPDAVASRIAIVTFDAESRILFDLSPDFAAARARLEELRANPDDYLAPGTRIDLGLEQSASLLSAGAPPGQHHLSAILLTDGAMRQDRYPTALQIAEQAREESNIELFAVGLGSIFDARFLEEIVGFPRHFSPADDLEALGGVYRSLAARLTCEP